MTEVRDIIETAVLPKLDGVRSHGNYWMARCPVHPDRVQSLQVGTGGKTPHVLLTCHAGCPREGVVGALGLTWRDLYPNGGARSYDTDPVATYTYADEEGTVLYKKTRHLAKNGGKYFKFWVPDSHGGWKTGPGCMEYTRRVLFRLPQLMAADPAKPVWYVEGEKDAMALAAEGEIATTSGGVNDWRPPFTIRFKDREVLIVADRDAAGLKHAMQVYNALERYAKFRWILYAKEGCKDASDHIRAGHGIEDFEWLDIEV